MKAVLIGLFAASAMSLLCETIMPDGKLKKCVGFFIGIAATTVAFSPIYSFFKNGISDDFSIEISAVYSAFQNKTSETEDDIEEYLRCQGINADVKIYTYCDKTSFVIFSADKNISFVKKAISSILEIEEEKIQEYP